MGWTSDVREYSPIAIGLGLHPRLSIVNIQGRNSDVDTASPEAIWEGGGIYTGQPVGGSAETIDVFSSNANDAAAGTGLRTVRLFGSAPALTDIVLQSDTGSNNNTVVVGGFSIILKRN